MNHAAFYDRMKRIAETMTKIQKREGNIAVAEYLRDIRYSGEFNDIIIEDEKDRKFLKNFLFTITFYYNSNDVVIHCFEKLIDYLDNNVKGSETEEDENNKVRTTHDRIVEEMQSLRESCNKYSHEKVEKNVKDLKEFAEIVLASLVPDNKDDLNFLKSLITTIRYYEGAKLIDNVKAKLDDYLFTEEQKGNDNTMANTETIVPIDKLAKQIKNHKNITANNVGFTILSDMMDLVVQSTNKLVDNIEEEDYANIRDKKVVKRDLDILVHSYSNILEVLGEYYVKLEK